MGWGGAAGRRLGANERSAQTPVPIQLPAAPGPPPTGPPVPSGFSTATYPSQRAPVLIVAQPSCKSKPYEARFLIGGRSAVGAPIQLRPVMLSVAFNVDPSDGGSSNGRTADSDSASVGSNPAPPAT